MFDNKELTKLTEQLEKQNAQNAELIAINKQLCKLLENERVKIDSIARFVTANSGSTAAFGVTR